MLSGDAGRRSSGEDESPVPEDDDMDVPVKELDEDIPLTKTGYSVPPAYPPIQVGWLVEQYWFTSLVQQN